MSEIKHPLKNAKVVLRKSPKALKIVLIVLILFSMGSLAMLHWVHNDIVTETENLRDEAAALEYDNEELAQKTTEIGSVQSIQEIAEEELGLVDPNTVIIDPQS